MQELQLIGITGGIGSGKSTASRYLSDLGYQVLSLDEITHEGYKKGELLYAEVKKYFPEVCDDEVDRKALAKIVFSDKDKLALLSKVTHPVIIEMMLKKAKSFNNNLVFVEVPLLFESNLSYLFKEVWLVYVSKELQIERVVNRDNLSFEEAKLRVDSQMSLASKRALADKIIDGSSIENIKFDINKLVEEL